VNPSYQKFSVHADTVLAILAALSAIATCLVLWRPDWLETVTGFDPDGGSGSFEWVLAAALVTSTVLLSGAAWRQHARRTTG
jgi:hypothetical protein